MSDQIDELASRVLDDDLSIGEIPSDVRSEVEDRVRQFAAVQARLRSVSAQADPVRLETAIRVALSQPRPSRRRSLLAAAGLVLVLGGAAIVWRGSGPGTSMAESDLAMTQAAASPIAGAETRADVTTSTEAAPDLVTIDAAPALASSDMLEFSSIEDVARAVARGDFTVEKATNNDADHMSSISACGDETEPPQSVHDGIVSGRAVRISVYADGSFTVIDIADCTILAPRRP